MDNLQKKKRPIRLALLHQIGLVELSGRKQNVLLNCPLRNRPTNALDPDYLQKKANYDDGEKRTDHDIDDHNDHDFDDHDDQDAHDDKTNPGQMCCFTGWH